MHLEDHPHAFFNENNIAFECIVFDSHDETLINQVKEHLGASYFLSHCDYGVINVGSEFYNNVIYPPKPFPSWIRDEINSNWMPPIPIPETASNWFWNEEILNWEEFPSEPTLEN